MKKRTIALGLLLILLLSLATGCNQSTPNKSATPTSEAKVIRIGYQISSSLTVLAKAKGFYEDEFGKDGTKVEYTLFLAGPPMVEALAGNRLDISNLGPLPAITARASGNDVKAVGRAYSDDLYYGLLISPNSPITSVKELKGKKIAVQVGSGAHLFLMMLLEKNGLKSSDVNIVNLTTADQKAALESGNVAAVATWQPFVSTLELGKSGKVLADSKDVIRTVGVYLARNEFGQKNPQLVDRFLKVHQRAAAYLKSNPDEAIALIAKESKFTVAALTKSLKSINWDLQFTDDDLKVLSQAKDYLKETNVIKKDFVITDLVDKTYLNALK